MLICAVLLAFILFTLLKIKNILECHFRLTALVNCVPSSELEIIKDEVNAKNKDKKK